MHDWIRELLTPVRASVLVNRSPTNEFQIPLGLRQGDPLSPFCFHSGDVGLHVALMRSRMTNVFMGISISRIKISHLMYVDGVMLVSYWDPKNVNCLNHII